MSTWTPILPFLFAEGAMDLLPMQRWVINPLPSWQLSLQSLGHSVVWDVHLVSVQGHTPAWKINWLLSGSKYHQNKIQRSFEGKGEKFFSFFS